MKSMLTAILLAMSVSAIAEGEVVDEPSKLSKFKSYVAEKFHEIKEKYEELTADDEEVVEETQVDKADEGAVQPVDGANETKEVAPEEDVKDVKEPQEGEKEGNV